MFHVAMLWPCCGNISFPTSKIGRRLIKHVSKWFEIFHPLSPDSDIDIDSDSDSADRALFLPASSDVEPTGVSEMIDDQDY